MRKLPQKKCCKALLTLHVQKQAEPSKIAPFPMCILKLFLL